MLKSQGSPNAEGLPRAVRGWPGDPRLQQQTDLARAQLGAFVGPSRVLPRARVCRSTSTCTCIAMYCKEEDLGTTG